MNIDVATTSSSSQAGMIGAISATLMAVSAALLTLLPALASSASASGRGAFKIRKDLLVLRRWLVFLAASLGSFALSAATAVVGVFIQTRVSTWIAGASCIIGIVLLAVGVLGTAKTVATSATSPDRPAK